MRRKKDLDKLLPKDSKKKKTTKGSPDRATAELIDRLNVIENIANRFFDSVLSQLDKLSTRIDNLEADFEQVIDALAQFGKGRTSGTPLRRKPATVAKPSSSTPMAPSKPTTPSKSAGVPSVPKIGGAPKVETKQGPNAPKF